jgi:hypothetical protein
VVVAAAAAAAAHLAFLGLLLRLLLRKNGRAWVVYQFSARARLQAERCRLWPSAPHRLAPALLRELGGLSPQLLLLLALQRLLRQRQRRAHRHRRRVVHLRGSASARSQHTCLTLLRGWRGHLIANAPPVSAPIGLSTRLPAARPRARTRSTRRPSGSPSPPVPAIFHPQRRDTNGCVTQVEISASTDGLEREETPRSPSRHPRAPSTRAAAATPRAPPRRAA